MSYYNENAMKQPAQARHMAGRAEVSQLHDLDGGLMAAEIRTEPEIGRLCAELDAALRSADDAASRLARKIECVVRPQPPQVNEGMEKQRGTSTQLGELLQRFINQSRATCNNLNSLADSVEL
jgi:hypothetical protein